MEENGSNKEKDETEQNVVVPLPVQLVTMSESNEPEAAHMDGGNIAKMRSARKYKLSQLTRRMNILKELMKDNMVTEEFEENINKYTSLLGDFKDAHLSYQALLNGSDEMSESENWYQTKMCSVNEFVDDVLKWKSGLTTRPDDQGIALGDSASVGWRSKPHSHSGASTKSKGSMHSSVSSARIRAEAEKAAAMTELKALKDKHALEEEEESLSKRMEEIRKRKETLDVQAELDAATAKINALSIVEGHAQSARPPIGDGMNEYCDKESDMHIGLPEKEKEDTQNKPVSTTHAQSVRPKDPQSFSNPYPQRKPPQSEHYIQKQYGDIPEKPLYSRQDRTQSQYKDDIKPKPKPPEQDATLYNILQKQNEITASLVKQTHSSSLPKKDITVFEGDPLEYR